MLNKQEISKKDTSNLLIKEAATIIKNAYAPYSK